MNKSLAIIENNILATNTIRYKLTSVLMQKGFDVNVLTTGTEKELQQARNNGFKIIDIKSSTKNPGDILQYMKNIRKALKRIKPDVVLTFTIRPAIWGNIITGKLKIPTITNITGIGPLFESNSVVYRSARTMYKFVLRNTAHIFFQNDDDMKLFLENNFVSPEKAERIPGSGIDHEFFKPIEKKNDRKRFSFLFISRLVRDKGIVEYVAAATALKNDFPDAEFCVLGPLWIQNLKANTINREELDSWIKEGAITYLGETTDVRPYIADSDCIVLPSYREGTSNVLLEAAAMECPAVTCDTPGCKEIIDDGQTGFLCQARDSFDLADKMKKMLLLPETQRKLMGKKARQKVIREFDKQTVINAYLRVIQKIIPHKS